MHSNHCIIYTENELMNFTTDAIDSRVLVIQPMHDPPFVFSLYEYIIEICFFIKETILQFFNNYRGIRDNIYELCGPFIMIIMEFARIYQS